MCGRKNKLGLVMSQFPDRLPRDVIDLFHSWIIHKVTSPEPIKPLKSRVGAVQLTP